MSERETHFEVYEDSSSEFRWRLQTGNGRIVADSGEGYDTEAGAWRALFAMRIWVETAFTNLGTG